MKFKKILLSLLICLSCFVQAKNITISRLTPFGLGDGIAGKWDTTICL